MSTFNKIKEKILSTPTARDFTPKDIQHFLEKYGFLCVRKKGSHYIYRFPNKSDIPSLIIPMHKYIKPAYIDQIRERIIEIEGEQK